MEAINISPASPEAPPPLAPKESLALQRYLCGLVFFALVAERGTGMFGNGTWGTIMAYPTELFFFEVPGAGVPFIDVLFAIALLAGVRAPAAVLRVRARPMDTALKLSVASIVLWCLWGVARGGNPAVLPFQVHWYLMMSVIAIAMIAAFRRPAHFSLLGKAILGAAIYRAAAICIFYFVYVRTGAVWPPPPTITIHDDSVLLVLGVLICVAYAIERKTAATRVFAAAASLLLLAAIQFNGRRIAFLSLIGGLALVFFVLPERHVRIRALRRLAIAAPVLLVYMAIGWGRSEAIFRPLYAFTSVAGEGEDTSSLWRNVENYNLIFTFQGHMALGTGFGHEYVQLSHAHDLSHIFPWYRYAPHNTVLGLLAFTGILGFACIWAVFPVTVFLATKTRRVSSSPIVRVAASVAAAEILVHTFQMYGDMGFSALTTSVLLASAVAVAGRLSATSGAWPLNGVQVDTDARGAEEGATNG